MTETIQLFVTCIIDTLYPEVGQAVVRVLERAGVRVAFPEGQTCCGQPAFNAGMRAEARRMAMHTIEVFEAAEGAVVVPSGSCAAMVRHGYLELFADEPAWLGRAQALAGRTYEFSEYLVDVLGTSDLGAQFEGRLTYHSSCHLLRDLGEDHQPRALLGQVRGAELVELPGAADCCGFGGTFAVKMASISEAMAASKAASVVATGADLLVGSDMGCLMQIGGLLSRDGRPVRTLHLAELLAEGVGIR